MGLGSGKKLFRIPDPGPGVKKAPDPGETDSLKSKISWHCPFHEKREGSRSKKSLRMLSHQRLFNNLSKIMIILAKAECVLKIFPESQACGNKNFGVCSARVNKKLPFYNIYQ
jgi:hypothetical protein